MGSDQNAANTIDRRFGISHLGQHFLGRNAAIHHPRAFGLAILLFDLGQELPQCRLVRGVAVHDFVGQWKTIRRDNQRDHDLHAIGTLVAAVAKLPLAIARRIAFEIGTGQIIQQHLEIGLKQIFPALAQEREHRLLVRGELVQTTIQIVRLHERQVLAE